MKIKIKFIGYAIAALLIILSACYSFFNGNFELNKIAFAEDTTDTEPVSIPGDVSQMFNERGFYKTNGFSADENEIVNDFNGNLMYEFPLYSLKGGGEINMNMKLVYNGSVNHQVELQDSNNYWGTATPPTKYNINCPEWIINVNGFGIQTLNFETYMLSKPKNNENEYITGNEVRKMIPGYHFDDKMFALLAGEKDKINILAGDGSTITLVNKHPNPYEQDVYAGNYYADSKGSHYKAIVTYIDMNGEYAERRRKVELMMGDGLLYIFNEYRLIYEDVFYSSSTIRTPHTMLLQEIRDRFGHKISLRYDTSGTYKGRPRLTNVDILNDGVSFNYYAIGTGITISNNSVGSYKLKYDERVFYDISGNKYGFLNSITNPLFQEATIVSEGYQRKLRSIPSNGNGNQTQNILCNDLKRIKEFKNFLKGNREYEYLDGNAFCSGNVCLEIYYWDAMSQYSTLASGLNQGHGRDPFYVNMLTNRKVYDENDVEKSETNYDYNFANGGIETFKENNIDSNDTYTCTTSVVSKDPVTVNNSEANIVERNYRLYPVKEYGNAPNTENVDVTAVTKMVYDVLKDGTGTPKEENYYFYHTGEFVSNGYCNGSFNLFQKDNITGNLHRLWTYLYEYKDGDNPFDSVITSKTEVDPLGYKTQSYYANFDITIDFLRGVAMLGMKGATQYIEDTISVLGQKRFYRIGVDTLIRRFSNNGNRYEIPDYSDPADILIRQQSSVYIDSASSPFGYYGQKKYDRIFTEGSREYFLETKYMYYKKDTSGRYLYSGTNFPFIEGNVKLVSKPDNQEEKYFYYPVTKVDTAGEGDSESGSGTPPVYYKIKNDTGGVTFESDRFIDIRMPTRVDNYRKINETTRDTLKTIYIAYNTYGNPTKIVNENGFLTLLSYDYTYNRIRSITLPGDFSSQPPDTITIIDTNYYYDTVYVNSTAWGHNNDSNDVTYLLNNPGYFSSWYWGIGSCRIFNMHIQYSENAPIFNTQCYSLMQFDSKTMPHFKQINFAELRFPVSKYDKIIDGQPAPLGSVELKLRPYSSIGTPTGYDCNGRGIYQISSVIPDNGYAVDIDVDTNTAGCNKNQYINISSMLHNYLVTGKKNLSGFDIKAALSEPVRPEPPYTFKLYSVPCDENWVSWRDNNIPRLKIYGMVDESDTTKIIHVYGVTYRYEYDDTARTVTIKSHLSNSPFVDKKVRYYFDGFGNIKQKDIFKTETAYDSVLTMFDFLNRVARTYDATNDTTMMSYDYMGRQVEIKNADTSHSYIGYYYQNYLGSYFGNQYNGFIQKQSFQDETGRYYYKYFDAVGNLLREEKFVAGDGSGNIQNTDTPFDPDTTYEGQDVPAQMISLITDYKYDNLYRLVKVKAPGDNKYIDYWYDGFGRQNQRNSPDAGYTKYSYDNNGNLILSQDAKQRTLDSRLFTGRTYDALNRLLTIGDIKSGTYITPEQFAMYGGDTTVPNTFDFMATADSLYTINVYDTITTAVVSNVFNELPSGYNALNYTRGKLVATAYRTNPGNNWNFKFYRYDERGSVKKLWHKIDGLGWKAIDYLYNSQNLPTRLSYQAGQSDGKVYTYGYDSAGRLQYTNLYIGANQIEPEEENDYPSSYLTMAKYEYNPDQQVDTMFFNENSKKIKYRYNNRNWLQYLYTVSSLILGETMVYNQNGTIKQLSLSGTYTSAFNPNTSLSYNYIYDNSNRLLVADNTGNNTFDMIMNYDKDGNFKSMKRYGSSNNLVDNFQYTYFNNTNRLKNIGSGSDYTYDANGNVTYDNLNRNSTFKYDWRNLLTEIRSIKTENGLMGPEDITYQTIYRFDEAGNRIFKQVWKYLGSDPEPVFNGDSPSWQVQSTEYYVRDITGKELVIYNGTSISQWNTYGLDLIGKIDANNKRYFYLKDHLGSIRATLDTTNTVISAQDYDCWGYPLENRTWQSNNTKYKFTGKEHDNENNYDYFGARYYDSRIANWTSVDPLFEKHLDYTPYNYVLRSPMELIDPDGKQTYNQSYNSEEAVINWRLSETMPDADKAVIDYKELMFKDQASGISIPDLIDKYGSIAQDYYGGNTQPTNIEFDIALLFFTPKVGLTLSSSRNATEYAIKEYIGKSSDIGLEWLSGKEATSGTAEELGKFLKEFMGDISPNLIKNKTNLLQVGKLEKIGKEIRIGIDQSHPFEHIDIERNAVGKIYKDLKLQISFPKF